MASLREWSPDTSQKLSSTTPSWSIADLVDLDASAVWRNDPQALRYLHALRNAGADALWIRGDGGGALALIFTAAIGERIEVIDEAPYLMIEGVWWRQAPSKIDGSLRRPPTPQARVRRWSGRRKFLFLLWEFALAFIFAMLAEPLVHLVGAKLTLPLWAIFAVSLVAAIPIGWFIGGTLHRAVSPYRERVRKFMTALLELRNELRSRRDQEDYLRQARRELLLEDEDETVDDEFRPPMS